MRLLIINADDFGLNDACNEGIIETFLAGSVTSTTLMVNGDSAQRASELALENLSLGVGLHFNLTWGKPISDLDKIPALIDENGLFLSRDALAKKLLLGRVPSAQINTEFQAQIERMHELGLSPTHIDSHQHVHGFNAIFSVIANYAQENKIPMRVPWVADISSQNLARKLRRFLLQTMLSRSVATWQNTVQWNDGLGSIFDLATIGSQLEDKHYQQILKQTKAQAFELMVHPVTTSAAMQGYTNIGNIAEMEYQYLRQGRLRDVASALGFSLGTYRDLPVQKRH